MKYLILFLFISNNLFAQISKQDALKYAGQRYQEAVWWMEYANAEPPDTIPPPTQPPDTLYNELQGLINTGNGTVNLKPIVYVESITLEVPTETNINGNGALILADGIDNNVLKLWGAGGNQIIKNLIIEGNKTARIINVRNRSNVIFDNIIFRNATIGGLLINHEFAGQSHSVTVVNCAFENCSREFQNFSYGALMPENITNSQIAHNRITGGTGYGIKGYDWANVNCFDNNIQLIDVGPIRGERPIAIEVWNLYDDCEVHDNISNSWLSLVKGNKRNGAFSVDAYSNILNLGTTTDKGSCAIEAMADDMIVRNNHIINARDGVAVWPGNKYVNNVEIYGNTIEITRSWSITTKGVLIQPVYKNGSADAHVTNVNVHDNTFVGHVEGVAIRCITVNDPLLYSENITIENNEFNGSTTGIYVHGVNGGTVRVNCIRISNNTFSDVQATYKEKNAVINSCN